MRAIEQRSFKYNPDLGLMPGSERRGEEVDVIARVLQSGGIGYWIPDVRVEHCIGQDRQTLRYVLNYFVAHGETAAFVREANAAPGGALEPPHLLFGVPRWQLRRLVQQWFRYRVKRLTFRRRSGSTILFVYASSRGETSYWRRKTHSVKQY